jgi:hypothetical protein
MTVCAGAFLPGPQRVVPSALIDAADRVGEFSTGLRGIVGRIDLPGDQLRPARRAIAHEHLEGGRRRRGRRGQSLRTRVRKATRCRRR